MSNPPVYRDCRPEAGPEGCSRPGVGVANRSPNAASDLRAVCDVRCHVAYSSQIAHGIALHFRRMISASVLALRRPSHDQRRAVLDVVKALAALDPAGFGLDDACAQLEGSTYVMAEEARRSFRIDQSSRRAYREDLVGAIAHPLRSRIRRGALQPPLSEQRCSSFNN